LQHALATVLSAQTAVKMMTLTRWIGTVTTAIALLAGLVVAPRPCVAQQGSPPPDANATKAQGAAPAASVDYFGDPLPAGALARLGTARLRGQVLTFSADGQTLITVGADRAFHYWDVANGKERRRKQLSFVVSESRFDSVHTIKGSSANGQHYVSHDNEAIRIWDTATGKELRKIPNPTFPFNGKSLSRLTVTNDGQVVAASLIDLKVRKCHVYLWNAATGKEHQLLFEDKDYGYPRLIPSWH
jgi:hypothetical protein